MPLITIQQVVNNIKVLIENSIKEDGTQAINKYLILVLINFVNYNILNFKDMNSTYTSNL